MGPLILPLLRLLVTAAALAALPSHGQAPAASWPSRPVRVIVPFPPGGPTDNLARPVLQRLSETLGQNFVIENRGGAGGNIGADAVAKAAPDGYTVLWTPTGTVAVNPSIYPKMPFDVARDLLPVTLVAEVQGILVVGNAVPAKTVPELVALARARPGTLNFASPGAGSIIHLLGEQFRSLGKIEITHVPYRGVGPAMTDLIGGQVTMMFDSTASALAQARGGKVRMLATGSPRRLAQAPDLPTMAEAGIEGFDSTSWHGVFAPAGTPRDVVQKLSSEIARVVRMPDIAERLRAVGAEPVGSTPEDLGAALQAATQRWGRIAREVGVRAE
jgi:tripartite-type tricarboxylate transporter receptor subunit TctC